MKNEDKTKRVSISKALHLTIDNYYQEDALYGIQISNSNSTIRQSQIWQAS
jgi:hypothetical protein